MEKGRCGGLQFYVMTKCGLVRLPFVYKVIRSSSVLAALKRLQMMWNTTLKQPPTHLTGTAAGRACV